MFDSRRKRMERLNKATREGYEQPTKRVSDTELFKSMGLKPRVVN